MKYEYYRANVNDKRFVKGNERVIPEILDLVSYKRMKVRSTWNKQPITYYVATLVGLDRLVSGESPEVYVYIGEKAGKALQKIDALLSIYEEFGVLKALQNYQFISHTIGYTSFSAGKYNSLRNIYKRFESQHQNLCAYDKNEFLLKSHSNAKTANENEIRKLVDRVVKHADGLIEELSRLRIDLSKLRKRKIEKSVKEESFMSALGLPPMLQKAIMIGGVIVIKAAARTIGSDANIDFDFDIDDSGIDVPNVDVDFYDQPVVDLDWDDGNNGYNISFGASENTDGYIPDGTISLERTVSGYSDTFPHYTKDGHDYVKLGSGNYVRIDQGKTVNLRGIKYDTI